jgi:hypothetical protein
MVRDRKDAAFQILSRISVGSLGKRVNSVTGSEIEAAVVAAESTILFCTFGLEEGGETDDLFRDSIAVVIKGVLGGVESEGNEASK